MSDDMKKEEEVLVPDTRKKRGRPRKGTDESKKETEKKKTIVRRRKVSVKVKPPVSSAEIEENELPLLPQEEKGEEPSPEPVFSQEEAMPSIPAEESFSEEKEEEKPSLEEKPEVQSEEKGTDEKEVAEDKEGEEKEKEEYFQKRSKYDRFGKKGKIKGKIREELVPEVNLEEHPDAPRLYLSDLATKHIDELREVARERGVAEDVIIDSKRTELIHRICRLHSQSGGALLVVGILDIVQDGTFGYLRYSVNNYLPGGEDVYVSVGIIKATGIKTGDQIYGQIRAPREGEKAAALIKVFQVNGEDPRFAKLRAPFDSLTPVFPDEKLHLEVFSDDEKSDINTRVVDLFCPIGKGQRSLIVAPPRTGKTVLMQKIANAITTNHPDVYLIVLLVDERPEEVTDMRRNTAGEVVASTFDEQATHHVQVAEMVIEIAKRKVEYKKDVVILLDSITRLARAYNQTVPASGKILSGGVDSNALHKPKRFFGAARNIEEGGSLTIISTALIETGSRMDEVIFEEFKGTGNNEIILDRKMADNRKFPAINIKKSGTRRDDLLLTDNERTRVLLLRSAFGNLDDMDMSVALIDKMTKSKNNKEFLESMNVPQKILS